MASFCKQLWLRTVEQTRQPQIASAKSNAVEFQQMTRVATTCGGGWVYETSAMVSSADAEGQGQSFETQSVRRRMCVQL